MAGSRSRGSPATTTPSCRRRARPARRRHRRHPDAPDLHRRGPRAARHIRALPPNPRLPDPVPARGPPVRAGARHAGQRGPRLPAQGARRGRRRLPRRRPTGRPRRLDRGPRGGRARWSPGGARDVPGRVHRPRARGPRADGRGPDNAAICERSRSATKTLEARINTIFAKLGLEPAADDNRRVLAVLALLRDEGPAAT